MKSNFEFVKSVDHDMFEYLLEVEKKAKLEPFRIGNSLRHVLERLCALKIIKYNLRDDMLMECDSKIPTLYEQFRLLRDNRDFIPRMRLKAGNSDLTPLPYMKVRLEYRDSNNKLVSRFHSPDKITEKDKNTYQWADSFLRQIGNDFSHGENPFIERVFKKTYDNVIYALSCLQEYIRLYYNIDKSQVPQFNADWMPIGNYEITGISVPTDKERTLCEKEYTANRYEDYRTESVGCSVIRQYPRTDSRAHFLRRAPDVYLAGDNYGSLLNKVTILSEGGHKDKPFYLVAYDFRTNAYRLNNRFLASLSFEQRLKLCLSYAQTMSCFHNNSTPIYHRVFSANCAYYADERDKGRGISTAIIKFEYAKIADGKTETVLNRKDQEMFGAKDDRRYIAGEWNELTDPTSEDWAKVDVYSLGILFSDILMGSIGGYAMKDMAKKAELRDVLPLVKSMISLADDRPDIDSVCAELKKLC